MKLRIKVIPSAKFNKVEPQSCDNLDYRVYVTKPAEDDKANKAAIRLLADHLNLSQSQILIESGQRSRTKLLAIFDL